MNILFVLYSKFGSNSSLHIHGFATCLTEKGYTVTVAVPEKNGEALEFHQKINYSVLTYDQILNCTNTRDIDIVHVWTPREITRIFCSKLFGKFGPKKYIIHLEDNEEAILMDNYGVSTLMELPKDINIPLQLSHPRKYKEFIQNSNGVTCLVDRLREFVPHGLKSEIIWPIIQHDFFTPISDRIKLRNKYNINKEAMIISYVGNVHPSNVEEVRSLYISVALANREGILCKLVRTGHDYVDLFSDRKRLDSSAFIELGLVDYKRIPEIINLADLLVQPGKPGIFNDYRLPSKLPEFFCCGRPVALPKTNVGLHLKDREDAFLMEKGHSPDILKVIMEAHKNPLLTSKLSANILNFGRERFSKKNSDTLVNFYNQV